MEKQALELRARTDGAERIATLRKEMAETMESGCGMVRKVASTADLLNLYRGYYCEVTAGPFDRKEDVK